MPAALAALDAGICEVRIQRAIDQEWRYMPAMAELGAEPYKSGDVASKLGRKTSEVSMIRQRHLDKGLVYATGCPSGGTERQPGRHMRGDRPLELLSAAPRCGSRRRCC